MYSKKNLAKCWNILRDYSTYEVTMDNIGQSAGKNLAWLAGFLEGDGSIGLGKHTQKGIRIIYSPYIDFSNTDSLLIEHCYKILDDLDLVYWINSKKTKNGTAWDLRVKGFKRCKKILPLLIPELNGKKKKNAELVYEWILSRENTGNNTTYTERELEIYTIIKNLNDPGYPQRLHARPLNEGEDIVRTVQKCAELSRNAMASL
jgi:hypothetical protein